MKRISLRYMAAAAVALACACLPAVGNDEDVQDETLLSGVTFDDMADFDQQIQEPAVPQKQQKAIVDHIKVIKKAIEKRGLKTELDRNEEVVMIEVPCSDLFAPNSAKLSESGQRKLEFLKDVLKYPTMYKVLVATYSDDTGEPEYCAALTRLRSENIADYFRQIAGVPETNIHSYGMGQQGFLVDNNSIAHRSRNRRVEIYVLPEWQMIKVAKEGKLK